jgi:26S proteasome regulatory subunit N11
MQGLFGNNFGGLGGLGGMGMQQQGGGIDPPMNDTAEKIYISPISLLKMLRHGKAGIPLEVMGLMLGDYIDEYTVKCKDVFSMPQSGTETTIESIDEGFQVKMTEMLKQTGHNEILVGWYHSHPGFGCWLSSVDINTQKTFEQQEPRTIAVVVDPIQSVRGKVVIDAFRTYGGAGLDLGIALGGVGGGNEQRQTTSNLGEIKRKKGFSLKELRKTAYYSILIGYRKNDLEIQMLLNIGKSFWDAGFKLNKDSKKVDEENIKKIDDINKMSKKYVDWIEGEINKSSKDIYLESVGKYNPRDHIESTLEELVPDNLNCCLTNMLNNLVF